MSFAVPSASDHLVVCMRSQERWEGTGGRPISHLAIVKDPLGLAMRLVGSWQVPLILIITLASRSFDPI